MKRILLSVFAAALTAAYVVPANAADVTFGGQYRLRGEYRSNSDYNDDADDSTNFWGQRVRFTADAKATDDTSVKITLQDTRTWGVANQSTDDGSGATLDNTVDLHESYLNVKSIFGSPINLRVGRQELAYGGERLISPGDWSNNARSFDAIKFMYSTADVNVDVFTSKITE
ncbi:MAG: alginate export family protein, partial [Deltaproteobacteria bacterium]